MISTHETHRKMDNVDFRSLLAIPNKKYIYYLQAVAKVEAATCVIS